MAKLKLFFILAVFFVFSTHAFAAEMSSETYSLEKGDFSSGGFTTGTSETYSAGGTFGEPLVGKTSGGTKQSGSGFQESGTGSDLSSSGDDSGSSGSGGGNTSNAGRSLFYDLNSILQNITVYVNVVANNILDTISPVTGTGLPYIGNHTGEDDALGHASYTLSDISKNRPIALSGTDIIAILGFILLLIFIVWRFRRAKQK